VLYGIVEDDWREARQSRKEFLGVVVH